MIIINTSLTTYISRTNQQQIKLCADFHHIHLWRIIFFLCVFFDFHHFHSPFFT